ncbi:Isochorismate synthase MenF [Porphyromonas levii]|uniref:aminodeoxychorismate synthase component I n=1 Tax=Porphyromonas levii TaxID=28114 RepID=UPI001B8B8FCF|nr:aminodeoxychorismate synthase component I [Porphyromonas levii]MBR8730525.1 Isochorismate synthase MenF [Porphyromonas levii]MBR8732399.1 Isochorismate synthase MenF [Porphyromonas levii]MBR8760206.1 Isochorismate synthase MenF [Porphyromonas levii]
MREKYQKIIDQMNQAGSEGKPFLFVLDYEQSEGVFIPNPLQQSDVLFAIGEVTNINPEDHLQYDHDIPLIKRPQPLEEYAKCFETIQEGMRDGRSILANLTVATPIEVPLSLKEILLSTNAKYRLFLPEAHFVCFSPERFVKIDKDGIISTDPMKGTIPSDIPGAPNVILNDYKETSEHCSVVDLLRSDLSRVADEVEVSRFRYFTEIETQEKTIYQVSSEIKGNLSQDWSANIGTIIGGMLPAGSILGAPRESTRKLIASAESDTPRGYYCGIFGYYDGKSLDSSVLIRFICEDEKQQKYYHSGGGVTINSKLEQEYKEVIEKIYLPLRQK